MMTHPYDGTNVPSIPRDGGPKLPLAGKFSIAARLIHRSTPEVVLSKVLYAR